MINNDEMKEMLEQEIIDILLDDIEVRILEQKEQLLKLGKDFANIVAKEKTSGSVKFKNEVQNEMEEIREQYRDLIDKTTKDIKFHNYIKVNQETISEFFNGWLRSEHYEIVKIDNYIKEKFKRHTLDKE